MLDDHYGQVFLQTGPVTKVQWFICAFTQSPAFHCGMGIGNGMVISAQPGGVRIEQESVYPGAMWSEFDLSIKQAHDAVDWIKAREGRPYNWVDDAMIGIESVTPLRFPRWMTRHWQNDHYYQCAQLADAALTKGAGLTVFDDGREPGRVSPGSFGALFKARGWWHYDWSAHATLTSNKF
jgi:uncharacterized protein YycO